MIIIPLFLALAAPSHDPVGQDPYAAAPNRLTAEEENAGWQLLFDGKTSAGWRGFQKEGFPETGWVIEDGCLRVQAGGGGGDIITRDRFHDFDLRFEWKVSQRANSGVMYRVDEASGTSWQSGPEYQLLDDEGAGVAPDAMHSAGALYDLVAPAGKEIRPAGQFNQSRIVLHGGQVEHWLNGRRVLECPLEGPKWQALVEGSKFKPYEHFGVHPTGHIALQDHGNDIWFRNLKIRQLPRAGMGEEIVLFNGRDLDGWSAFLSDDTSMEDVWRVEDGILICRGTPSGYIYTDRKFDNFVLRLEWRFNPVTKEEGNSGVLIRQEGEHKVWPRSIEAQLQSRNAGDFWQIGDYPMKTDPARAQGRNTKKFFYNENPPGEWNQYEIIADGPVVILKVNGKVLNEATGALVQAGPICLQSEGVEIQFRNVRVAPLKSRAAGG